MSGWDFSVVVPDEPGTLAQLGEAMGGAGVNIEGIAAYHGAGTIHVLVDGGDHEKARHVFHGLGWELRDEGEVLVEELQDRPGVLGEQLRRVSEAGVNLRIAYLATRTRLVLGADDFESLQRAWAGEVAKRR